MITALKLWFIYVIMAAGAAAIIWFQWPEAMKPHGYSGGYDQGPAAAIFLAVILTAIPVVLYVLAVHVTLSHWLFRPGEMTAYRARQRVNSLPAQEPAAVKSASVLKHDD